MLTTEYKGYNKLIIFSGNYNKGIQYQWYFAPDTSLKNNYKMIGNINAK